jgi:uncharacterized protein (DUF2336 family)
MTADVALLREVEAAATSVSGRQRSEMLRRVTDLFIVGAPQYTDDQIALFDDVFVRLALEIESSARALLAARLAPIPNAPPGTIRKLAFDSEIDVAGPILSQSERLCALIENASEMSQEHLFAISQRRHLNAVVTDVLVERGDRVVAMSAVSNSGARFSEGGFAKLVGRSEGDDELAERVGARPEIPPLLFRRLLLAASEHVRAKLESEHPWAKRQFVSSLARRPRALARNLLLNPVSVRMTTGEASTITSMKAGSSSSQRGGTRSRSRPYSAGCAACRPHSSKTR